MITKNKKEQAKEKVVRDCVATKEIMVDNEIMKVETEGRVINVLTKMDKNGKSQELIRIDSVCGNEIGRIKFVIKNE
ncbi:MAG: hypothetical protein KGQ36_04975 [Rickettsiales bacterium]|nr:hypothetical protein [Rickettsiales bacterium]